jgi:hypothetical protein
MGTLKGLALHSAPPTRPATPSLRSASPNPPALWLRRAKPVYAYAVRCVPLTRLAVLGDLSPLRGAR